MKRQPAERAPKPPAAAARDVAHLARATPVAGAGNRAIASLVSGAQGLVVQRDIVEDIEDKMSYGAFDWAVTDDEATDSLALLAALAPPALTAALSRLSPTAKTRLLDNLPSSAKQTSGFTKVLVAMGPDAVQPYLESLLSYGVFDWAVTDDDAATVFRIFMAITPPQQVVLTGKLGAKFRHRLADNLAHAATVGDAEHTTFKVLFDNTPDAELDTLKLLVGVRFKIDVGTKAGSGDTPLEWDAAGLRRMYNVLQALPPGAVEANPDLARIDRYVGGGWGGYYSESKDKIGVGYTNVKGLDQVANPDNPGGVGMANPGDPLAGHNIFDGVIRHEVGHAVDKQLGLSKKYCIGRTAGGDWRAHGDGTNLAVRMAIWSGGTIINLPVDQRVPVLEVLQSVIDDRDPTNLVKRMQKLAFFSRLPVGSQTAILTDPAAQALRICFADINNPWYTAAGGGVPVGGRIFQEAYKGEWWSYDPAARAQKVSAYQFRSPAEWIAEAYNAYYAPPTKGGVLAASDPATKEWFDVNVDVATGGAGATAPGPALPAAGSGPGFP